MVEILRRQQGNVHSAGEHRRHAELRQSDDVPGDGAVGSLTVVTDVSQRVTPRKTSCPSPGSGHGPMRRRYLIAIIACIAALPLAALAQQAVPSIAPQVHEEMWAIPSSPVPMLAYLVRPVGGGPFPLVVMNHGVSLDAMGRSYFPVIEFRDAALWFARQGYVV